MSHMKPFTAIIHTLDQHIFVEHLWATDATHAGEKAGNLCGVNGTEDANWGDAEPYTLVALLAGHHETLVECGGGFAEENPL